MRLMCEETEVELVGWDKYFYNVCVAVGDNSKCLSRKIGAVLVRGKSIISTGYNGPPSKIPHCETRSVELICPRRLFGYRSGEGLHLCIAGHAERNCLINAARLGIATDNTTIYMSCPVPCKDCMIELINAGIKKIIVTEIKFYDEMSKYLLKHSNIRLRAFGDYEYFKTK